MKKRFLKVSFFCLLMACMPATFTSCKDYDDDIAVLTQQTGSLQSQVNSLEEALNANKEAAAQAAQAAADAMDAAKAAQQRADDVLKEAERLAGEAKEKAVEEAALAAAEADAKLEESLKFYAEQAAATAKAEAIAEVMEQVKDLMDEQRALTEKELAELAGRIDGIEKGLNELSGALEGVNGELDRVENELTDKINVVADDLAKLEQAVAVQQAAFEEFQTLINGKIATIEANYADLLDTVQGLESSVADLQAADEAIKADIAAVKASVQANATAIAEINTRIDEIEAELDALDKKIDDVKNQAFGYTDAEVAELKAELMEIMKKMEDKLGGEISTLASKLTNALNTLSTVFADRLTSITLMPDAYADGIPCIDFSTAVFKEMAGEGDNWNYTDAKAIRLTPNAIPVSYRLSPKSVNQNTIVPLKDGGVAFVEKTASILTRGAEDDCILKVADFKVENGVLTVTATKNGDAAINKTQDGKINIAALRVKQIPTTLDDKTTIEGAEVYSEYARVTEGVFEPSLAEIEKPTNHLAITPAKAEIIAEVPCDETLNLNDYVSVCKTTADSHNIMTAEELAAYDFTVEFALADYNKTVWSKVEKDSIGNYVVTPGFVREDGTFSAHDKKASKKENVYRATLKHGEKVIDVKFVKVYFLPPKTIELTIPLQGNTSAISCNPVEDYSFTLTWRQFTDVFNNDNIRLLNPKEFHGVYTAGDIKVVYKFNGNDITKYVDAVADVTLDAERQYAMSFTFNHNIPAEVKEGNKVEKVFPLSLDEVTRLDIEVICTPNYLKEDTYPVLTIATSLTIEPLRPYLAEAANQNKAFWEGSMFEAQPAPYAVKDQYTTLRVLPLQYGTTDPRDGSMVGEPGETCEYYFPIKQAFMLSDSIEGLHPSIVKHHERIACSTWDMFFAANGQYDGTYENYTLVQPDGYIGSQSTVFTKPNAYVLKDLNENKPACVLRWAPQHTVFGERNDISCPVFIEVLALPGNNAGKILVHHEKTTKLTLMAKYPNDQQIPVRTYDLKFVKPLNFSQIIMGDSFTDGIQGGSKISTYDAFNIIDFRGYKVAKNNELYNYYGISNVTWHVDEARMGIKHTGDLSTLEELTLAAENGMTTFNPAATLRLSDVPNINIALTYNDVTGELVYNNHGGVPVEQPFYLVVPVSITHKWAPEPIKTMVVIPVNEGTIKNKVRK